MTKKQVPAMMQPSEAAMVLGKNPATVRRACASGAIKAVKFGEEWLINREAFYQQFGLEDLLRDVEIVHF